MTGLELAFTFGGVIGLLIGLWLGGRSVLYKMHKDDVQDAHKRYDGRREKYL